MSRARRALKFLAKAQLQGIIPTRINLCPHRGPRARASKGEGSAISFLAIPNAMQSPMSCAASRQHIAVEAKIAPLDDIETVETEWMPPILEACKRAGRFGQESQGRRQGSQGDAWARGRFPWAAVGEGNPRGLPRSGKKSKAFQSLGLLSGSRCFTCYFEQFQREAAAGRGNMFSNASMTARPRKERPW